MRFEKFRATNLPKRIRNLTPRGGAPRRTIAQDRSRAAAVCYPRISCDVWYAIFRSMLVGSLLAGAYGILHDQVTFTLSPEYYTEFKFEQFANARFGLPDRGFVAVIGFLASWWVGLLAGWLFARIAFVGKGPPLAGSFVTRGFGILIAAVVLSGFAGFVLSKLIGDSASAQWQGIDQYGVSDVADFARVGLIHLFGYLGALLGLVSVAIWLWWKRRKLPVSKRPQDARVPTS